jgi:hypothetical protein
VVLRQNDDKRLLVEQLAVQGNLLDRGTQESYIDFLHAQRIILEARENVVAFDFNRWPAFAMVENNFADRSAEPRRNAHPNNARFPLLRVPRGLGGTPGLHDEFSRFFEEGVTRLGQFYGPFVAHK